MKKIIFILILLSNFISPLCYADVNGLVEVGGSYNDQTKSENIYFDGRLSIRKQDIKTKIEYSLLKNQSEGKLHSLNSEAEIQSNFYNGILGNNFGFVTGIQKRYSVRNYDYDKTSLGAGIGKDGIELKGFISSYCIQGGIFANSNYEKSSYARDIFIVPQIEIEGPIFGNLQYEEQCKSEINFYYTKDWQAKNKLRIKTAINDHVDLGITWLCDYRNVPENGSYHENVYLLSVKSKF